VLSFWLDQVEDPLALLKTLVNDEAGRVRLEAVRALSFLQGDEAIEAALEVLNHDTDKWLEYTLEETMRQLEMP
jgi:HEAT repeat protein